MNLRVHRTGTASAILLSALGVPWETVREDYLLTNEVRHEETVATLEKLRNNVAQERGIDPSEVDTTNLEAFFILEGHYRQPRRSTVPWTPTSAMASASRTPSSKPSAIHYSNSQAMDFSRPHQLSSAKDAQVVYHCP